MENNSKTLAVEVHAIPLGFAICKVTIPTDRRCDFKNIRAPLVGTGDKHTSILSIGLRIGCSRLLLILTRSTSSSLTV